MSGFPWFRYRPPPRPTPGDVSDILNRLEAMEDRIMAAIDDLRAAVAAEETQEQAVLTYLKGLPDLIQAELDAHAGDAAALDASIREVVNNIANDTTAMQTGLAAAPQPPAPAPAPTPAPTPAPVATGGGNTTATGGGNATG